VPTDLSPDIQMTGTHSLLGSPRYMAPEQMRSTRKVDHRADLWSLGVVMHEALTGEPPFVGETLPEVCAAIAADDPVRVRQLRRDVPIELQDVILRCLAKDPDKRYATVSDLARDLAPFLPGDGAAIARRVTRIVRGGGSSTPPPRLSIPASSTPTLRRDTASRTTGGLGAGEGATARTSLSPMPIEVGHAKRDFRGWAVLLVGVGVALPAFFVGAMVSTPSGAPEARTTPSPTAEPRATTAGGAPPSGSPLPPDAGARRP
jgi:serine/threonine protein kinase